jgi:hypothetical protein
MITVHHTSTIASTIIMVLEYSSTLHNVLFASSTHNTSTPYVFFLVFFSVQYYSDFFIS